ncbi:MAG: 50S ribosomal protein L18 [Candidatus Aenigmatarchaeota archaeon]|nr:50S ribosomal protein L18 [Nanoarchaeota archaeon]
MARGKIHIVPHRRRREGKTDYRLRLKLLKSKKPRLVVRKSANNITCQIVKHDSNGDHVVVSVNASHIKKLGWKGHSNIPSAYLTGYLCATNAKKHNISSVVFDMGLYRSTKGSKIYAALKGAVDAGLDVPHSDDILPKEDRISGKHISNYASNLKKEKPEKYKKIFSAHLKNKLEPENLSKHFEEIKKKIAK